MYRYVCNMVNETIITRVGLYVAIRQCLFLCIMRADENNYESAGHP